jgi:hypothetical protein
VKSSPQSSQSSHIQHSESNAELNPTTSRSAGSGSTGSFKEKIKQKGKQKACCGLPCWSIFVIIGVLLLGVVVGTIIGGVVGSREAARANGDAESFQNLRYGEVLSWSIVVTDVGAASLRPP